MRSDLSHVSQLLQGVFQAHGLTPVPATGDPQMFGGDDAADHLPRQPKPLIAEAGDFRTVEEPQGYTFACVRHQFARRAVREVEDLNQSCPHCDVEREERPGRLRYAALQLRLSASL